MVLKYTSGCICSSLTVDDVEEIDLRSNKVRRVALRKIGNYIESLELDNESLEWLRDCIEGYLCFEPDELKNKTKSELCELIRTTEPRNLNYVLQFVVERYGKLTYKSKTACECCGDYVYEYTLEV